MILKRTHLWQFGIPIVMAIALIAKPVALTTVEQVAHLTSEQRLEGYPVRIHGVVTEYGVLRFRRFEYPDLFVQDSTGGIYVEVGSARFRLKTGDLVDVVGSAGEVNGAPAVLLPQITVVGTAPLPSSSVSSFADLDSGHLFSRWVDVRGSVRRAYREDSWATLDLLVDGHIVELLLQDLPPAQSVQSFESLVGASVHVQGVLAEALKEGRLRIYVPDLAHITLEGRQPLKLDSKEVFPMVRIRKREGLGWGDHVRVRGGVTLVAGRNFYMQDPSGGLLISPHNALDVKPGDRLEVTGYMVGSDLEPELSNALVTRLATPMAIAPRHVHAPAVLQFNLTSELISLEGKLVNASFGQGKLLLTFEDENVLFAADVDRPPAGWERLIVPGSVWSMNGIAQLEKDRLVHGTRGLRMLIRQDGELRMLRRASWWTLAKMLAVLGVAVALAVVAAAWLLILKRKVRQQTEIIRQRLEKEIALQERYHDLFANANDMIFSFDAEGKFVSMNAAGENITGYSPDEIGGMNIFDLIGPESRERMGAILETLLAGQKVARFEIDIITQREETATLEMSTRLVRRPGETDTVESIAHDVTQRKASEAELRRARDEAEAANRAKSDFLANMSHELRTPLNGIVGMTELLRGTSMNEEQGEYLSAVSSSAALLMALINDVLDFSKIEAGKLELDQSEFFLREVVGSALQSLTVQARQKGLALVHSISPDTPDCLVGDRIRLVQVINNLVSNAIKFTASGEVSVEIGTVPGHTKGETANARLQFSVRDTGIGIPLDKQGIIFDSFTQADSSTTRKYGGTGLGLSISSRLVRLMNGEIRVSSEPAKGSTFSFTADFKTLPDSHARAAEMPAPFRRRIEPPSGVSKLAARIGATGVARVLLAEDNKINQMVAKRLLERAGCTVTVVDDGRQAVDYTSNHSYDAVFMDVQMPQMDGWEATRAIREREQRAAPSAAGQSLHVPIIAMTAHALAGDRERCLEVGMDGYIAKPVDPAALTRVLEEFGLIQQTPICLPDT